MKIERSLNVSRVYTYVTHVVLDQTFWLIIKPNPIYSIQLGRLLKNVKLPDLHKQIWGEGPLSWTRKQKECVLNLIS